MVVVMNSQTGDTAAARRATAAFVTRACQWADLDAVVLIVSELVANAARHTTGGWQLGLEGHHDRLTIDVDDSSQALPVAHVPNLRGEGDGGGLGWHIVRTLAASVEIIRRPGGKTIRATWLWSAQDAPATTTPVPSSIAGLSPPGD